MITFRFARASDINVVLDMWEALIAHHVRKLRSRSQSYYAPSYLKSQCQHLSKKLIPGHHIIIAEDSGRPIGFIEFTPDIRPPIFAQRQTMKIGSIYVRTDYRRRGVGERLVEQVARIAAAKKITELTVLADLSNTAGLRFYADCGFEKKTVTLIRKLKQAAQS